MQLPAGSPAAAAGPRPPCHELAYARHRVRKGLTHSLAGCHAAKLLTNSSGCLPESPGAAAPSGERDLEGVVFQAVLVVIPPCQRMRWMQIIRQRVENETGITEETRRSALSVEQLLPKPAERNRIWLGVTQQDGGMMLLFKFF